MSAFSLFFIANFNSFTIIFFTKKQKVFEQKLSLSANFVETFFISLKKITLENKINLQKIEKVYAGIGPGSFITNRAVVIFLKVMQIFNANLQLFTINNLFFQSQPEQNTFSLLTVNQKRSYFQLFRKRVAFSKMCLVSQKQLESALQTHSSFVVYQDFIGFDQWLQFQKMIDFFVLVKNWKELQAIEI